MLAQGAARTSLYVDNTDWLTRVGTSASNALGSRSTTYHIYESRSENVTASPLAQADEAPTVGSSGKKATGAPKTTGTP